MQLISVKVKGYVEILAWCSSNSWPSHLHTIASDIVRLSPLHFDGIIHLSRHRRHKGFPGSYGDDYMQNTT